LHELAIFSGGRVTKSNVGRWVAFDEQFFEIELGYGNPGADSSNRIDDWHEAGGRRRYKGGVLALSDETLNLKASFTNLKVREIFLGKRSWNGQSRGDLGQLRVNTGCLADRTVILICTGILDEGSPRRSAGTRNFHNTVGKYSLRF
jgi:hypothetical protein